MRRIIILFVFLLAPVFLHAQENDLAIGEKQINEKYQRLERKTRSDLEELERSYRAFLKEERPINMTQEEWDKHKNYYVTEIERLKALLNQYPLDRNKEINDARIQKRKIKEAIEKQLKEQQREEAEKERERVRQIEREQRLAEEKAMEAERERIRNEAGQQKYQQTMGELRQGHESRSSRYQHLDREAEALHKNVNAQKQQEEFLGDKQWRQAGIGGQKAQANTVRTNENGRGTKESMELHISHNKLASNIDHILNSFIFEAIGEENTRARLCQVLLDSVCHYYHVDPVQFFWGTYSSERVDAIYDEMESYTRRANELWRSHMDKWVQAKNIPTWNEMAEQMSRNHNYNRFISIVNILSTHNSGTLPVPVAQDKYYYYYNLSWGHKVARVSKKEGSVDLTDDFQYEKAVVDSRKTSMLGQEKKVVVPIAALFNDSVKRHYQINVDGSGSANYPGKYSYQIQAPKISVSKGIQDDFTFSLSNSFTDKSEVGSSSYDLSFKAGVDIGICKVGIQYKEGEWSPKLEHGEAFSKEEEKKTTRVKGKSEIGGVPMDLDVKWNEEKKINTVKGNLGKAGATLAVNDKRGVGLRYDTVSGEVIRGEDDSITGKADYRAGFYIQDKEKETKRGASFKYKKEEDSVIPNELSLDINGIGGSVTYKKGEEGDATSGPEVGVDVNVKKAGVTASWSKERQSASVKVPAGAGKVGVGYTRNYKNEDGYVTEGSTIKVEGEIGIVSAELSSTSEESYHKLASEKNESLSDLPSDLVRKIYASKSAELNQGIHLYEGYTIDWKGDMHKEAISHPEKVIQAINASFEYLDIPDYHFTPSTATPFELCLVRGNQ